MVGVDPIFSLLRPKDNTVRKPKFHRIVYCLASPFSTHDRSKSAALMSRKKDRNGAWSMGVCWIIKLLETDEVVVNG